MTLFVPLSLSSKNSMNPAEVAPFLTDRLALCTLVCEKVTAPAEAIVIESASEAEPIVPPLAIARLPARVTAELSTFNLCVPPVVIATSFAALKKIPESVSPVLVIDGALAEPAANYATDVIVGAARVTTDAVALNPDVKSLPSPRRV